MNTEVTRDVVSDLWPLYRSGEASAATRRLVEEFLSRDAQFASLLKESETMTAVVPPVRLSPEGELQLLQDIQHRARTKMLIVAGAVGMAGLLALASLGAVILLLFGRAGG